MKKALLGKKLMKKKNVRSSPASSSSVPKGQEEVSSSQKVQKIYVREEEEGLRLDRWFRHRYPSLSVAYIHKIIRTGQVRCNKSRAQAAMRLTSGDEIRIPPLSLDSPSSQNSFSSPRRGAARSSTSSALNLRDLILYEDRDLVVLNKPFGLAVQGGSGLVQHIDGLLDSLALPHGERPRLVHRLDRETSGVLLVARSRRSAAELGEIFRTRQTRKIYWAIVHGVPKPLQGRISLFLAKGEGMGPQGREGKKEREEKMDSKKNSLKARDSKKAREALERVQVVAQNKPEAQHSLTYYAVMDKVMPRLAWVSLRPITGRTHQLRAHMEAIGHPIIGDSKYKGQASYDSQTRALERRLPEGLAPQLHLLARRLILPHPRGGVLDVMAPLPPHFQQCFDLFGFESGERDPLGEMEDV